MTDGAFSEKARAAVYEAGGGRCIGCGRSDPLTAQHRNARGMGGTSRSDLGEAANGVPLDGSGTTGCHGWVEHHPAWGRLLGWVLEDHQDPTVEPFWTRFGWRRWQIEDDGFPSVLYVDPEDLDRPGQRGEAVRAYEHWLAIRNGGPK